MDFKSGGGLASLGGFSFVELLDDGFGVVRFEELAEVVEGFLEELRLRSKVALSKRSISSGAKVLRVFTPERSS